MAQERAHECTHENIGDIIAWLVNPGGRMRPYDKTGHCVQECRLPAANALIESGVADIVALPEAHIDTEGARRHGQRHAL